MNFEQQQKPDMQNFDDPKEYSDGIKAYYLATLNYLNSHTYVDKVLAMGDLTYLGPKRDKVNSCYLKDPKQYSKQKS